ISRHPTGSWRHLMRLTKVVTAAFCITLGFTGAMTRSWAQYQQAPTHQWGYQQQRERQRAYQQDIEQQQDCQQGLRGQRAYQQASEQQWAYQQAIERQRVHQQALQRQQTINRQAMRPKFKPGREENRAMQMWLAQTSAALKSRPVPR